MNEVLTSASLRENKPHFCIGCVKADRLCSVTAEVATDMPGINVERTLSNHADFSVRCERKVPFPPPTTEGGVSCSALSSERKCLHPDLALMEIGAMTLKAGEFIAYD